MRVSETDNDEQSLRARNPKAESVTRERGEASDFETIRAKDRKIFIQKIYSAIQFLVAT